MKNDIIELITETLARDQDGFPVSHKTSLTCFADVKSGKYAERYAAAAIGLNIELIAVVSESDYAAACVNNVKPSIAVFDGYPYRIHDFTYRLRAAHAIELKLTRGN